jgi:hypothetical protein
MERDLELKTKQIVLKSYSYSVVDGYGYDNGY